MSNHFGQNLEQHINTDITINIYINSAACIELAICSWSTLSLAQCQLR